MLATFVFETNHISQACSVTTLADVIFGSAAAIGPLYFVSLLDESEPVGFVPTIGFVTFSMVPEDGALSENDRSVDVENAERIREATGTLDELEVNSWKKLAKKHPKKSPIDDR